MSTKQALERLAAADPALAATEEELALSRERSLAVRFADAEQLTVAGSVEQFHKQSSTRRIRRAAGVGLVAATVAVVAGVAVSGVFAPQTGQPQPAATSPVATSTPDPNELPPLPELTGRMPTFDHHIVTGGNGNKAAVANNPEADFHMDALNGGTLGLNSAGCLVSESSEDGLIFPRGTKITETGVVFPNGTILNIGEKFAFGGGGNQVDPGPCAPSGWAFLVQSWDPVR
ncbi:hypothetical protein ACIQTZ_21780 [Paenarthrobacter sp. NPDC090520]|uniref:hypothetical protein n=1 Tax=Paenarthrobacter sp. NPDC090520 TaxID=3364382 RepID=UPI00380B0E37